VVLALGVLAACTSTPSAKRVALDVVETLDVTEEAKACMVEKIETDYTNEQLEAIGAGAESDDPEAEADLEAFEADLADCVQRTG
jgi:hypothetical protein